MGAIGNDFPEGTVPVKVDLEVDGVWTDITDDVRGASTIDITRGRANESTRVTYGRCALTLNNRNGKYSNRNPNSEYFGLIGRNTPIRVYVEMADRWLQTVSSSSSYARCPDAVDLGITGDIDIRIEFTTTLMTDAEPQVLAAKYFATGSQRSWVLRLMEDRTLELAWSTDGTTPVAATTTRSTEPVPTDGPIAVRATLDVDNGAAGNTTTFYTATTISGSWTQLGDTVVESGTTSIFDSTAQVTVAAGHNGGAIFTGTVHFAGNIYAFELRNGINGTVVANPNFRIQTEGDTSFNDTASTPNTWTVLSEATITNKIYRFHGEVSSWPQKWDTSGNDVYVPIDASGILRRLAQGTKPLKSPLYRVITGQVLFDDTGFTPDYYWPLDDGANASYGASGLLNGDPILVVSGTVNWAADEELPGGDTHPEVAAGSGVLRASPEVFPVTNGWKVHFWFKVNASSGSSRFDPIRLRQYGTPTTKYWAIETDGATNAVTVRNYADDGTLTAINPSVTAIDPHDGEWHFVELEIEQTGANEITCSLRVDGNLASEVNTAAGLAVNSVDRIEMIRPDGTLTDVSSAYIAHLAFYNGNPGTFDTIYNAGLGFPGETVGARLTRLLADQDITFELEGDADLTETMGPQPKGSFLDQVYDAADTDQGILYEPRDFLGLAYRTRQSLLNQMGLGLSYEDGDLSGTFEPIEDDQLVLNDATARRPDGSSARFEQTTGPLSVNAPPDGVGRYATEFSVNVETDAQLANHAAWMVGIGTWDEARFAQVTLELHRQAFVTDDVKTLQAIATDVGDYLSVADPPSWLPPDLIELLAQGSREILSNKMWTISFNCVPAGPYDVGVFDDGVAKYDSIYSTLAAQFISGTNTSMSVAVEADRELWVTGSGSPQFPFDIRVSGVRLTVTAISGASSPQTFTITQTPVNGVTKTIPAGTQVRLWKPARYSF